MDLIVFEDAAVDRFGPIVAMRHAAELRCGRHTMLDRCERLAVSVASLWGRAGVSAWAHDRIGRRVNEPVAGPARLLSARVVWEQLPTLDGDAVGVIDGVAVCVQMQDASSLRPEQLLAGEFPPLPRVDVADCGWLAERPWDLVLGNGRQIAADCAELPATHFSDPHVHCVGAAITIGEDVSIAPGVVLDSTPGPIWIGDGVTIKANATIEGPCVIGPGCTIQHHAQIHDGVTLGPRCKIGGEVEASIIQGFSNKQHYGFLGHSYLGEWINLGAGCTTSDLKNTYGTVRVPIGPGGVELDSGSLFCGLTCGDYAKLGINTAVPTGAVIGVGSNVMGSRVPKHVPPMRWVVDGESSELDPARAIEFARRMMSRRDRELTAAGTSLLKGCATASV